MKVQEDDVAAKNTSDASVQEKLIDTATCSNIQPTIINFVSTNDTLNADLLWALGAFVPIIHLIINPMWCKFFKRCFQHVHWPKQ